MKFTDTPLDYDAARAEIEATTHQSASANTAAALDRIKVTTLIDIAESLSGVLTLLDPEVAQPVFPDPATAADASEWTPLAVGERVRLREDHDDLESGTVLDVGFDQDEQWALIGWDEGAPSKTWSRLVERIPAAPAGVVEPDYEGFIDTTPLEPVVVTAEETAREEPDIDADFTPPPAAKPDAFAAAKKPKKKSSGR